MASFHGGWSLAACLGALIGFIMIVSGVTPFWHFTLIALLIGVTVLVSRKYLQEDVAVESPEEEKEAEKKEAPALLSFIRKPEMLLIQFRYRRTVLPWWWKVRCLIGVDFTSNR